MYAMVAYRQCRNRRCCDATGQRDATGKQRGFPPCDLLQERKVRHGAQARRPVAPVEPPDSGAAGSSALQKSFSLLEHLIAADRALTLAELVEQMDMPKASVHRLLLKLEAAQLLKRDLTGKRYVPGDRLTRFSLQTMVCSARMAPVRAILERLVAETGESINLGVLDGSSVAYIQRVECNWPLRTHLSAGSRVPLYCTATGKLFLALMPKSRQNRTARRNRTAGLFAQYDHEPQASRRGAGADP